MTGADWTGYLEMYKPSVVIVEQITPSPQTNVEGDNQPRYTTKRMHDEIAKAKALARMEVLDQLHSKALSQVDYFDRKQREFTCLDDCLDEEGELHLPDDIGPLLRHDHANGRMSEAAWWRDTIQGLKEETGTQPPQTLLRDNRDAALFALSEWCPNRQPDELETILSEVLAALAVTPQTPLRLDVERITSPQTTLHGPYGWLIKPIGLAEDAWYLANDPSEHPAEEVSVPLFAKEEQALGAMEGSADAN
jgi:hypothetical protein